MFCKKCGQLIEDETAKFCDICGTAVSLPEILPKVSVQVSENRQKKVRRTPENDNKKLIFACVMVAVSIILIVIAILIYLNTNDTDITTATNGTTISSNTITNEETTSITTERYISTQEPIQTTTAFDSVISQNNEPKSSEYYFIKGKYTWEEAKWYCEANGGHLATIHSDEDWNKLIETMTSARNTYGDVKYIWLGALSTLNDDLTISFSWVDSSDTSYIMGADFIHWYYNSELDIKEPSGYDASEYMKSGVLIREPYLMLWYVAPKGSENKEWSLNDAPDVSAYSIYTDENMGFVMEIDN